MFQRIQSIFLLICLIAWTLLFFFPIIGFADGAGGTWTLFYINGISEAESGKTVLRAVPMTILLVLVEGLALIALWSYRRRTVQLRVTVFNMMLQLLSYGIILLYTLQGKNLLSATPSLLFWSVMPLIAGACSYLAFRGIRRDILLLRAQDRLR